MRKAIRITYEEFEDLLERDIPVFNRANWETDSERYILCVTGINIPAAKCVDSKMLRLAKIKETSGELDVLEVNKELLSAWLSEMLNITDIFSIEAGDYGLYVTLNEEMSVKAH